MAATRLEFACLAPIYWPDVSCDSRSTWFGDEMMDVTTHADRKMHHKHGFKHSTLLIVGLSVLTVLAYYQLLNDLGVAVPGT